MDNFKSITKTTLSADGGTNYGYNGLVNEITRKYLDLESRELMWNILSKAGEMSAHSIHGELNIADWGGGNGIVSKFLRQNLNRSMLTKKQLLSIDVIDVDDSKRNECDDFVFINGDIRNYVSSSKYAYSVTRNTLHYLSNEDQSIFIKNMLDNTLYGASLINFTCPRLESANRKEFENALLELTGIERHFVTKEDIFRNVDLAGWWVKKDSSYIIHDFDYEQFLVDRFNIDACLMKELKKTGIVKHIDYENTVLYCSSGRKYLDFLNHLL